MKQLLCQQDMLTKQSVTKERVLADSHGQKWRRRQAVCWESSQPSTGFASSLSLSGASKSPWSRQEWQAMDLDSFLADGSREDPAAI